MNDVFILNPAATKDDIQTAIETRAGQARGICAAMSTSVDGEDVDAIGKTFWAVEHLLDEIIDLHTAIINRNHKEKKGGDHD